VYVVILVGFVNLKFVILDVVILKVVSFVVAATAVGGGLLWTCFLFFGVDGRRSERETGLHLDIDHWEISARVL